MRYIDAAGLARVEDRAAGGRRVYIRSSRPDSVAQTTSCIGHQPVRCPVNPPEGQVVPQARCDRRAITYVLRYLVIAEIEEVCANEGERMAACITCWQAGVDSAWVISL
jgi:hypothetical protein